MGHKYLKVPDIVLGSLSYSVFYCTLLPRDELYKAHVIAPQPKLLIDYIYLT